MLQANHIYSYLLTLVVVDEQRSSKDLIGNLKLDDGVRFLLETIKISNSALILHLPTIEPVPVPVLVPVPVTVPVPVDTPLEVDEPSP
jgi:hypothetical protein